MRRVAMGMVLLGACGPAAPAPSSPAPRLAAPPVIAVAPAPAPLEPCVSTAVERELACAPDDVRVTPLAPVWPSGDHLFHYPPRRLWVSPVLPASVTDEVAKLAPSRPKLLSAEKALATATHEAAALEEGDTRKRARVLEPLWKLARDAYAAFLKDAPKDDALRPYAYGRVALLSANLGQIDEALAAIIAELAVSRSDRALRDLGRLYARSKRAPDDVGSFTDEEVEAIADAYVDAMRYDAARTVLGVLAKRGDPAAACVYGARQVSTWIVQSPAHPRLMERVRDQMKLEQATTSERCREANVALLTELGSAMNVDAVGWKAVRGTGDMRVLRSADALFELLEQRVPWSGPTLRFPWLPDEGRPTAVRLAFARANLALFRKDWAECGPLFSALAAVMSKPGLPSYDPAGALRAAALANATRCHASAAAEARTTRGPLTHAETELLELGRRMMCTVEGDHTEIALQQGRALYRTGQWERAAAALAKIAFVPGRSQAREAAAMYLVALHRQREATARASCSEQIERDRERLLALHCSVADEDDPVGPSIAGLTVRDPGRLVSPCEAIRAIPSPPPALPPSPRAPPPIFRGDYTMVSGNVVPEVVAWATRLHLDQLQACYDLALQRDPYVSGTQSLAFTIARDGSVGAAKSTSQTHQDGELDACMTRVAGAMAFSQPEGGVASVSWRLALDRVRGVHFEDAPRILQADR